MNQKKEPIGLGGWLILPMLGLMFMPVKLGVLLITTYIPIFSEGHWDILTNPESEVYHGLWAPLLIFEIIGNLVFLLASMILLVLFFQKHHRFPQLMIMYFAANLAFVGIDFFAADLIPAVAAESDPESTKELIRTIVGAAIWIPYFKKSRRVQNTFTKGRIKLASGDEG